MSCPPESGACDPGPGNALEACGRCPTLGDVSERSPLWPLGLSLLLGGCLASPPPTILDDDDDATAADDDDDDDFTKPDTPVDQIETVTFALSLDGAMRPDPERQQLVSELTGTAHILYWRDVDDADMVCRQRFDVSLIGVLGAGVTQLCAGCEGRMRITEAALRPPDEDSACGPLPPSVDLGFLVAPDDDSPSSDFRQLELIPWAELEGSRLTRDGLLPEDVAAHYLALGLEAHFLAAIAPNGWLGEEADLGEVAQPWAEEQLLPMFVLYSNADDGDGASLDGPLYLTSLWRVGVGESVGATPAP